MGRLVWIVVGLVAGWLASRVMRSGRYGRGGEIIVSAVGAVIGGFLAGMLLNISRMRLSASKASPQGGKHHE